MQVYQPALVKHIHSLNRQWYIEGPRILVAIHHQRNRNRACCFLSLYGYRNIVIANTGADALRLYMEGVDLVVLGHYLSDMSGAALCKAIRRKNPYKNTPIIGFFDPSQEIRQQYHTVGITDFLSVTGEITDFKKIVRQYIY